MDRKTQKSFSLQHIEIIDGSAWSLRGWFGMTDYSGEEVNTGFWSFSIPQGGDPTSVCKAFRSAADGIEGWFKACEFSPDYFIKGGI